MIHALLCSDSYVLFYCIPKKVELGGVPSNLAVKEENQLLHFKAFVKGAGLGSHIVLGRNDS